MYGGTQFWTWNPWITGSICRILCVWGGVIASPQCKDTVLDLINQKGCSALQHLEDIFDAPMQRVCVCMCLSKYVRFLSTSVSFWPVHHPCCVHKVSSLHLSLCAPLRKWEAGSSSLGAGEIYGRLCPGRQLPLLTYGPEAGAPAPAWTTISCVDQTFTYQLLEMNFFGKQRKLV